MRASILLAAAAVTATQLAGAAPLPTQTGQISTVKAEKGTDCPPGTARDPAAVANAIANSKGDAATDAELLAGIPCVSTKTRDATGGQASSASLKAPAGVQPPGIKPVELQPPGIKPADLQPPGSKPK